jgi:hypothetical protein
MGTNGVRLWTREVAAIGGQTAAAAVEVGDGPSSPSICRGETIIRAGMIQTWKIRGIGWTRSLKEHDSSGETLPQRSKAGRNVIGVFNVLDINNPAVIQIRIRRLSTATSGISGWGASGPGNLCRKCFSRLSRSW